MKKQLESPSCWFVCSSVVLLTMSLTACSESAVTEPKHPSASITASNPRHSPEIDQINASERAKALRVRNVTDRMLAESRGSANEYFGEQPSSGRSPQAVCAGMERLMIKYMPALDSARGLSRSHAAQIADAKVSVGVIAGCGSKIHAAPVLASAGVAIDPPSPGMRRIAVQPSHLLDENDDTIFDESHYFGTDSIGDLPNTALSFYTGTGNGPSDHSYYYPGMNEYQVATFEGLACESDNQFYSETTAVFMRTKSCGKDMWYGCAAMVGANWRSIVKSAMVGARIAGFWGGTAAAVGAGVIDCGVGAVLGYIYCQNTQ